MCLGYVDNIGLDVFYVYVISILKNFAMHTELKVSNNS